MHHDKPLDLPQQVLNLLLVGESRMLRLLLPIGLLTGAAALYGFWKSSDETANVFYLFTAGISAMLVLASWLPGFLASWLSAGPVRHAATALRNDRHEAALLQLHPCKDVDDEHQFSGRLQLAASGRRTWDIHFAPAGGWKPQPGTWEVDAVFLSDLAWPALVLLGDQGLLYPRSKPKRAMGSQDLHGQGKPR